MNKLSKQQYKNKNLNVKGFISLEQLILLESEVFPKFLNGLKGKQKTLWQSTLNRYLPKNKLGFNNENDYLRDNKITIKTVIINSILYCLPNLEKDDVNYLTEQFSIFTKNSRIKIFTKDNKQTPIYFEIINSLSYILNIQSILNKYPKNNGNHYGTKHRSSSRETLIKNQLNILENRLEGRFFNVENDDEIEKLKIQIKFMKLSLTEEYKHFAEWINFAKIYLGFDNDKLDITAIEKKAFNQLLDFFNGIRTSKEELLTSVMIYLRTQSNIADDEETLHKELSQSIMNITRFFLNKTIIEVEKSKKKKTVTYKKHKIKNDYCIKTILSETLIYTYVYKNTDNPLEVFFEASYNSILGIHNIFEKDKPKEDEISNYKMAKSAITFFKEYELNPKEYKAFLIITKNFFENQNYLGAFNTLR